ncbi:MAG: Ralstonia phage RsoM1USA [Pseudomonadota bacterium]|jgi:excinuclease UvrABC nuclease subunit
MAERSISIEFSGFWNEYNKGTMPAKSGIYCVYAAVEDSLRKRVDIDRLLYIGESDNVKQRLEHHDGLVLWKHCLKRGQTLCFSFGPVAHAERERSEAALIYQHKPPANVLYTDTFPFQTTRLHLKRQVPLLQRRFEVHSAVVPVAPPALSLLQRSLQLIRATA